MSFLAMFYPILLAAALGGGSAGLLGVFVIGLRMPFLAVCTAHAAMAGAVFAELMSLPHALCAFGGALLGAALLGWVLRKRDLDPNAALGTLFSLTLGLSFLGIGLSDGPKSGVLGLMWGTLIFVTPGQILVMGLVSALFGLFLLLFGKELKAILFSRRIAASVLPESGIFAALLIFSSAVIAVNLEMVGGLLLYSLIANPAIAAMRIARTFRATILWSMLLGALSALGGFVAAYWLDLPVGACVVLASCLIVAVAVWISRQPIPPVEPKRSATP